MKDEKKVDICECDVEDKELLASYRERRSRWVRWLHTDSKHNIERQIAHMLWDDTLYRTFGNIFEWYNNDSSVGYNPSVMDLFIRNFFIGQAMRVRRLTDSHNKKPISLVTLIEDVKDNIGLITRENYVCHDGKRYDTTDMEEQERNDHLRAGEMTYWSNPDIHISKIRHAEFDKLCGIMDKDKRTRTDRVDGKRVSGTFIDICIINATIMATKGGVRIGESTTGAWTG